MSDIHQAIKDTVESNRVVLFMKGTKTFPQCGFSARAVDILTEMFQSGDLQKLLSQQG